MPREMAGDLLRRAWMVRYRCGKGPEISATTVNALKMVRYHREKPGDGLIRGRACAHRAT
eukprot:7029197-Prymnesium_polylepis.1